MDEFGETPSFYIWPAGHEEGTALPPEFYADVIAALENAGYQCESI